MPLAPDIFGDVNAEDKGASDIFKDLPASREAAPQPVAQNTEMIDVLSRPRQFVGPENGAARMAFGKPVTRQVPAESPIDRGIYQAGGLVNDALYKAGLPIEAAAAAGYLTNVGLQSAATLLTPMPAKKPLGQLMETGAQSLMNSALKPTFEAHKSGEAARAVNTMLKEGYNATNGGLSAIRNRIDEIGSRISDLIAKSPATIDKGAVAARLQDDMTKAMNSVNPMADLKAIESAWTEFLSHPQLAGRSSMTVQEAQKLKQGTYQALGGKAYGELGTASTEAQKTLARGLKEEISKAVPEVAGLNARQGELLAARDVLARRMLMQGNNNPLGLAALRMDDPASALTFMADKNALLKSLMARGLYLGSNVVPENALRLGLGILSSQSGQGPEGGALYQP